MTIQLRGDYVAIEPIEKHEKVTEGGIVIAGSDQAKVTTGYVRFVGPGKMLDNGSRKPLDIPVGSKVDYEFGRGTKKIVDEVELIVMDEKFVELFHTVDTEVM